MGVVRICCGPGARGPRGYWWARVPIRICWRPGRGHGLLARRNMSTGELAYYVCYGPQKTRLLDLARIAATRWAVEECFQQAKNTAGLDEYQVRDWRAWYAHITLSMAAPAWLVVARAVTTKGNRSERCPHQHKHVWWWSHWRRRRQHQARLSHYKRRGYPLS